MYKRQRQEKSIASKSNAEMSRLSFIRYLPSVETVQPLEAQLSGPFCAGFEQIQDLSLIHI